MRNSTSIAAALLLMAGCLGDFEVDQPGPGGDSSDATAEVLFASLHQQLNAECALCHADGDSDTGPDYQSTVSAEANLASILDYTSIVDGSPLVGNSPANSKLFIYGAHTGPAMSVELAGKVEDWIIQLAVENGNTPDEGEGTPGVPEEPKTLVQALTKFAECMAFTDFEATNFQDIANQNTAEGACRNCHETGQGGAFLSTNDADFFTQQKLRPYILKFASGTVAETGAFSDLIPSERYELKRNDNGHPNYLLADARVVSMEQFFELTYTRYRESINTGVACVPDLPPLPQ